MVLPVRLALVSSLFALATAGGCAGPCCWWGRPSVAEQLAVRTGYDLGPIQPLTGVSIPDDVAFEDGLTEEEAVAIGLWNNALYREQLSDLNITRADLITAAQLQNPQLTTMFPLSVKQWELALNLPLDVLWLRPVRVAAAQMESARVAQRLTQDGLNTVREVRLRYVDWQIAVQRLRLAQQDDQLRREILRIADSRLRAGAVAQLDVDPIRLETVFGEGTVVRASRDVDLALQRLRFAMGIQLTDVELSPAALADPAEVPMDLQALVVDAIAGRPDLRAVQYAVSAATRNAELAEKNIWGFSGLLPDINSHGLKGFEAGPGAQFNLPIFHQNQGAVARALADAERLRRQYVTSRDTAVLEVHQAYTQWLQAWDELHLWRDQVVPLARQSVASARRALEEDGVSLLVVLETTRQLTTAQGRQLDALALVRRSMAELERSVGHRLFVSPDTGIGQEQLLPAPVVVAARGDL